jgi:uncharacterized protein (DUF362 family)
MRRDSLLVFLERSEGRLAEVIASCLQGSGILGRVAARSRVALKPNLTYPYFKRGVTTSPAVVREIIKILRDVTKHIAIVETGGGYGAWAVEDAFRGHGLDEIAREYGAELVNLTAEPSEMITFRSGGRERKLPLPVRLLHETDVFITMPVPKIHCMTGVTLAYKNQWGCIPDTMRLRRHYIFDDAIVAINRALKPAVLADGTYFLDGNGPMEGEPVRMDLIIGASDAGSFDRYVSELMGVPWQKVPHLRRAVGLGDMPASLAEIKANAPPEAFRTRIFKLKRTTRNWIALSGLARHPVRHRGSERTSTTRSVVWEDGRYG